MLRHRGRADGGQVHGGQGIRLGRVRLTTRFRRGEIRSREAGAGTLEERQGGRSVLVLSVGQLEIIPFLFLRLLSPPSVSRPWPFWTTPPEQNRLLSS